MIEKSFEFLKHGINAIFKKILYFCWQNNEIWQRI